MFCLKVTFRNKDTFRGCSDSHSWACYNGHCGYPSSSQRGLIDSGTNGPAYNDPWCESETFQTRTLYSDKPFQMWWDIGFYCLLGIITLFL